MRACRRLYWAVNLSGGVEQAYVLWGILVFYGVSKKGVVVVVVVRFGNTNSCYD